MPSMQKPGTQYAHYKRGILGMYTRHDLSQGLAVLAHDNGRPIYITSLAPCSLVRHPNRRPCLPANRLPFSLPARILVSGFPFVAPHKKSMRII